MLQKHNQTGREKKLHEASSRFVSESPQEAELQRQGQFGGAQCA